MLIIYGQAVIIIQLRKWFSAFHICSVIHTAKTIEESLYMHLQLDVL